MKQYRLPVLMYQPTEDTEYKYMAEIPVLPGCRAWGNTPAEALGYLQSVAAEFIESYRIHGHVLPKAGVRLLRGYGLEIKKGCHLPDYN